MSCDYCSGLKPWLIRNGKPGEPATVAGQCVCGEFYEVKRDWSGVSMRTFGKDARVADIRRDPHRAATRAVCEGFKDPG